MRFPLLLTVLQAKPSLAILWTKLLESQGLSEHLLHLAEDFITPRGAGVSEVCRSGGEVYLQQLQQGDPGALKMLDASAKFPPAGEMTHKIIHHPGRFDACLEVSTPAWRGQHCLLTSLATGHAPLSQSVDRRAEEPVAATNTTLFHLHRALGAKVPRAYSPHRTDRAQARIEEVGGEEEPMVAEVFHEGLWKLGMCVPSVCSPQDVAQGLRNFMAEAQGDLGGLGVGGSIDMDRIDVVALNCHTADEQIPLDHSDWRMIGVTVFFATLVTIGTLVDLTIVFLHREDVFSDTTIQLLQGFSLYRNTTLLLSRPTSRGSLDCINGIRSLSMTWVVLCHGYSLWVMSTFTNNWMEVFNPDGYFLGSTSFAVIFNAFPCVDSFFLIGATLLSYLTLRALDMAQGGGPAFWVMYFLNRYVRLSGIYAIVLALHATLLKLVATGIQSNLVSSRVEMCRDTWWANLLYINNFTGLRCLGQTWYLAADMQFFLTSPIIIFTLWKNKFVGLNLLGGLLLAFTILPTYLSFKNQWGFSITISAGAEVTATTEYYEHFYVAPWCRYQPYLVGLGLGHLLHRTREQPRLPLRPTASVLAWAAALLVLVLVVFGLAPYQKDRLLTAPVLLRSLYGGLHRLAWALALSWVILACARGAGGPVNTFLSWHLWTPLNRMSYTIYLVHMTIMQVSHSYASYRVDMSQVTILYDLMFSIIVSISVSYLLIILFEAPLAHLWKLVLFSLGAGPLPPVQPSRREKEQLL